MQIKKLNNQKVLRLIAIVTGTLLVMQAAYVLAANTSTFSQLISDGSLDVDIVDADGVAVESPSVSFDAASFSFASQEVEGVLGETVQKIRVYNPTGGATWTVSIAATGGATSLWSDGGSLTYDYNDSNADGSDDADTDSVGGKLSLRPSEGTLSAVAPCASVANISKGSNSAFKEVATAVNSITLLTADSGAPTYCRWDLIDVNMTQVIPAAQGSGTYTLGFTITIA